MPFLGTVHLDALLYENVDLKNSIPMAIRHRQRSSRAPDAAQRIFAVRC